MKWTPLLAALSIVMRVSAICCLPHNEQHPEPSCGDDAYEYCCFSPDPQHNSFKCKNDYINGFEYQKRIGDDTSCHTDNTNGQPNGRMYCVSDLGPP
ncbi:unnamed protein product [Zymoseptoria tritici ST99CH_3D7]|uniref:Extracellular membrane protein CFEM domain-containing protein n=1 Tax=Zymoseptoria tritici (strain ST99CH_3D7) TaxID=1276538 RepID=A0A1X7RYX8_ZYMT9|nr:unnamed protein product [Zymoseptoria tritici ST99CH_3D7]